MILGMSSERALICSKSPVENFKSEWNMISTQLKISRKYFLHETPMSQVKLDILPSQLISRFFLEKPFSH